jgi:hypothetical protein
VAGFELERALQGCHRLVVAPVAAQREAQAQPRFGLPGQRLRCHAQVGDHNREAPQPDRGQAAIEPRRRKVRVE